MNNSKAEHGDTVTDEYSESDDLLYSQAYGIRQFAISDRLDLIVLGVMLEESEDSFLVAMPIQIKFEGGHTEFKRVDIMNQSYIRLMKSAVRIIAFPDALQEKMYVDYLFEKSSNLFPELLAMIGIADIPSKSDDVNHEACGLSAANGASDLAIDEKVKKAISEGCLIPGPDKVKH